jgi:hypothetical protein
MLSARWGNAVGVVAFWAVVIAPFLFRSTASAAAEAAPPPTVVEIPEDTATRGDWIGVYGRAAYYLCGMRSPKSLYGGPAWPIDLSVSTGDPKENGRAWRSTMPSEQDRTILLEPNGLTRTPASFDDFGETRPPGKGPDLHLRLALPEGPHLLSLYFFEVDWPQYRAYTLSIYSDDEEGAEPILTTKVADFLKGKYKRFAVIGPARPRIVIAKGRSPNAIVSGVFLDPINRPDTALLDIFDRDMPVGDAAGARTLEDLAPEEASAKAADVLAALVAGDEIAARYLDAELGVCRALQRSYDEDLAEYLKTSVSAWADSAERLGESLGTSPDAGVGVELGLLRYHALRNAFNYAAATAALAGPADALAGDDRLGTAELRAETLNEICGDLLSAGRRGDGEVTVRAYCGLCLRAFDAGQAKEKLIMIGHRSVPGRVTAPCAEALLDWEGRHGEKLTGDDEALLANLLYLSGMNAAAVDRYRHVAQGLEQPSRRKWVMVALMSAELKAGQIDEALSTLSGIEAAYPDDPALHDAMFRLALYYFDRKEFNKTRERIDALLKMNVSEEYKGMCIELLSRIEYQEKRRTAE